ncbi:MAG: sigma-70 family RNA polymerase sigma factor [Gammaproteobacteria bacterium]|nr:sigma-70 family RNA polymerase sigma factor [Gammaproteobacteria bacterium]
MQLIAVAKDRDREAFEILFRHFSPRVRAYLVHRGSDTKNVDDILQDVFATVWQKANLYDHQRASAAAWIFTIARNRRIDALRNERRPEFDPQDPALQRNPVPGGEETFIAWQHAKTVRIALDVLSDEQREVLRLSFYEGESYSAIAVRLGIPLGTVKSRARLAFARLRTELGSKREDL